MSNPNQTTHKNGHHRTEAFLHQFAEKSGHWEHELQQYGDKAQQYIQKHPVKSTLIAGVVGLFLGKILSR